MKDKSTLINCESVLSGALEIHIQSIICNGKSSESSTCIVGQVDFFFNLIYFLLQG